MATDRLTDPQRRDQQLAMRVGPREYTETQAAVIARVMAAPSVRIGPPLPLDDALAQERADA